MSKVTLEQLTFERFRLSEELAKRKLKHSRCPRAADLIKLGGELIETDLAEAMKLRAEYLLLVRDYRNELAPLEARLEEVCRAMDLVNDGMDPLMAILATKGTL